MDSHGVDNNTKREEDRAGLAFLHLAAVLGMNLEG